MFCNQCEQAKQGGCDKKVGVCGKKEDIASLQDITIYGLKGVAAYAHHARELGYTDPEVDAITHEALYSTLTNVNFSLEDNIRTALRVGEATIKAMDLLDRAHTQKLGLPQPVTVTEDAVSGKSILVTGHNLHALEMLLAQSEGKGINVYTHSEMLPAHGYPGLKKYSHLKGNVGKAWHDQRRVFDDFPGAILVTTNCVMPVRGTYGERMFTYDVTGVEGDSFTITDNDFSPLITRALSLPDADMKSDREMTTGFHHENVLQLAPQIIEAVKSGSIRRFFVIAGCDAPGDGGEYFRELAELVPDDCVILTTSCGKFRFNDIDFGDIDGIPRYIDLGQCNNSISAVKIAVALAEAFECSVNELPLSIFLSWFEQKAVAILLGLFSLGVRDIHLGPKPPEFVTAGVLAVLQDTFNLKLTTDAVTDMNESLGVELDKSAI
ncbi:MAG: hydroxylamine reductase [Thermoleophilia bacterium]